MPQMGDTFRNSSSQCPFYRGLTIKSKMFEFHDLCAKHRAHCGEVREVEPQSNLKIFPDLIYSTFREPQENAHKRILSMHLGILQIPRLFSRFYSSDSSKRRALLSQPEKLITRTLCLTGPEECFAKYYVIPILPYTD